MTFALSISIRGLLIALALSSMAYAGNIVACKSFYLEPVSIEYGLLFQEAKDVETIEALNERSKDLIFATENPDPLDHLINTLLYYRALSRVLTPQQLEIQFPQKQFRFVYRAIKAEVHKENKKFNYFRSHLLGKDAPTHVLEPALH